MFVFKQANNLLEYNLFSKVCVTAVLINVNIFIIYTIITPVNTRRTTSCLCHVIFGFGKVDKENGN